MKSDPTFWLIARASGMTAYVVLTASVLAGLTVKSRPFGRAVRAASATDVHRFLALLALGALALHGISLAVDSTVHIGAGGLFVPGLSAYRPVPVAAGVLAAELMLLVVVSFSLRRRIGVRNWRRLHWATYLVFVMATVHGLSAGTDSSRPWIYDLYLGAIGAVVFAAAWRTLTVPARPIPASTGGTHVQDRDRPLAL